MSDTLNLANSIWLNGMQVDSDGHAVFYPLGTNKIDVSTTSTEWPKGSKLISPFVYDDEDNLVGFCDTKAITASGNTTITLDYKHVEADFSSLPKDVVKVTAPNASFATIKWSDGVIEDITNQVILTYESCKNVSDVLTVNSNYWEDIDENGSWTHNLPNLTDGTRMFLYSPSFQIRKFNADLSSLEDGTSMFTNTDLEFFYANTQNLTTGDNMFEYCDKLATFINTRSVMDDFELNYGIMSGYNADFSKLISGYRMFAGCYSLQDLSVHMGEHPTSFTSLTNGKSMFEGCSNLRQMRPYLPKLVDGSYMFSGCYKLNYYPDFEMYPTPDDDLSCLKYGDGMFSGCSSLTSFRADLSSLESGYNMFANCSSLTSFRGNLSSLIDGNDMFYGCYLDVASVQNIADTINTVTHSPSINIDINGNVTSELDSLFFTIHQKGWNVYVNNNLVGEGPALPPLYSTDENGEQQEVPVSYWFKPIPAQEENAQYVDSNGNYYNIIGAQYIFVSDPETYGQFTSIQDAALNMNLTKIERN